MGSMKRGAALMLLGLVMPYSSQGGSSTGTIQASAVVAAKNLSVTGDAVTFTETFAGDTAEETKEAVFTLSGSNSMPVTIVSVILSNSARDGTALANPWLTKSNGPAISALSSSDGTALYPFNLTTIPGQMSEAGTYTADITMTVTF